MSETSKKGTLAVTKTIADLTQKGYDILIPIAEYLKFDLVAHKDDKFFKIQVKYSLNNPHNIKNSSTKSSVKGNKYTPYIEKDLDYYAIYLVEKDTVVYPSFKFGGKFIRTAFPDTDSKFYWYEDFLDLTDEAKKRSMKEFGIEPKKLPRLATRKPRPSKEELQKLISEMPMTKIATLLNVSDNTIGAWCNEYGIKKSPRGFWTTPKAGDIC